MTVTITTPIPVSGAVILQSWGLAVETDLAALAAAVNSLQARCGGRWHMLSTSIPNNASTNLTAWTEDEDTEASMWTSGSLFTIPKPGLWAASYRGGAVNNLTAATRLFGTINFAAGSGSLPAGTPTQVRGIGNNAEDQFVSSWVGPLVTGNTLQMDMFQNEGTAQNMTAQIAIYRVGL